jgi:hypothetical protein
MLTLCTVEKIMPDGKLNVVEKATGTRHHGLRHCVPPQGLPPITADTEVIVATLVDDTRVVIAFLAPPTYPDGWELPDWLAGGRA